LLAGFGRYSRALAEKRALLATGGGARQLTSWNELLARHGAEIAAGRAGLVAQLDRTLDGLRRTHAPELPPLTLLYQPSPAVALGGETELFAALENARAAESARRRPLVGPHRDEIEIRWDGALARDGASAGERKAVGLLLLAALGDLLAAADREPMLLVDDADAELDPARLARVVAAFTRRSRLLLTSSRSEVWSGAEELVRVDVGALAEGASRGRVRTPEKVL
jgi:DNA replication and repair protein RecF